MSPHCLGMNLGGTQYVIHIPFAYLMSNKTGMASADDIVPCDEMLTANVSVAYCPGDFVVYKPLSHPHMGAGYVTCKWRLSFKCFCQQMKRERPLEQDL